MPRAGPPRGPVRGVVMIDTSHANSCKDPARQPAVAYDVAAQLSAGDRRIVGLLIESNLVAGRQDLGDGRLAYGQSTTDGCIDWEAKVEVLRDLADTVAGRLATTERLAN